jgi:hypothetical protein
VAPPAPPPPDLSAVAEPSNLVVFARASKPSAALKVIGDWTHLPVPGSAEVATLVLGESVPNVIDLDQPIDFALTLDGQEPHGAISAAVRSLDDAKLAFSKFKLVPGEDGVLRIIRPAKAPSPDQEQTDDDEPVGEARVCELAPAFGTDSTRLICAESADTLKELGPFLARTAPRNTFPADVHVEMRLAPVRPVAAQMRHMLPMLVSSALGLRRAGLPELEVALRAAIDDVLDFTSDADGLALDAMLGEPEGTLTFSGQFRSSTSLLSRLAVGHPERAGAPPASFWKLPADADAAYFQRGVDASDVEHARDHLVDVLAALLGKTGMEDADRKAAHDVAAHTFDLFAQPSVYAKGFDGEAAAKATAALKASGDGDPRGAAAEHAAEELAGWAIIGIDAPASRFASVAKEWAALWARAGVAKWLTPKSGGGAPFQVKMAALPKGISGKDAAHLEVIVPPAGDSGARAEKGAEKGKGARRGPASKPLVLHALVVPDGGSSWLVLAADVDLAVAKVKEVLAGTGSGGLASRDGLAALKDAKINAGGFVSPRAFAAGDLLGWTLLPVLRPSGGSLDALEELPDHGTTPVLMRIASQTGGGAAGSFTATATIPKAAIDAFIRMAMH